MVGAEELLGTHAVPIAMMAFLVVRIRFSIFRDHFLSQLLITLLSLLALAVFDVIVRMLISAPLDDGSIWRHFGHLSANAVYSALVTPILIALFFRLTPILGFTSHGPRSRILDSRR
jgi:cell shape-determining protein MreD